MEKMVINNEEFFAHVTSLLSEGKTVTIPVKGFSMQPFIVGEKDLVVLEKPSEVRKDDIILFRYCGRWILHRALFIDTEGIVHIQGDGVVGNREHCSVSDVYGKVITILRDGTKEIDPYTKGMLRRVHFWQKLHPVRRYLLGIMRRLPWSRLRNKKQ